MLSNFDPNIHTSNVRFVSYDGKYPNLCSGRLVLEISGKEYAFSGFSPGSTDLPKFWCSGGSPGEYRSEWIIDADFLPDDLKQYALEIDAVFNANVEHGCCGGCL